MISTQPVVSKRRSLELGIKDEERYIDMTKCPGFLCISQLTGINTVQSRKNFPFTLYLDWTATLCKGLQFWLRKDVYLYQQL